ncbi:metallophosphoesterase [Hamadaea tsunoensis]|uniref:metallophosphoesterase n=1 Tax=Hamadaea tsunoensis TaxID=53368 RepID=UPI000415B2ED|nr:metallophosphoesterase [Hamadaea tsunoensis]
MLLAQISDLHLDGTERATERARRTMAYLRRLPIDALLVTGDIADTGSPAEYEEAAALFDLPFPVLHCPGNHDARPAYRKGLLNEAASDAPVNSAHRVGDALILMIDASIPGEDPGFLAPETLSWLDEQLAAADGPALLAFHQPPVKVGHPIPDGSTLQNAADLDRILDNHPHVAAILTGHAHTAAATTYHGRPLIVSPAVTWTLRLPFEGEGLADLDADPAVAFHLLDGDQLITHFRIVR